jgi:hypothetical protein
MTASGGASVAVVISYSSPSAVIAPIAMTFGHLPFTEVSPALPMLFDAGIFPPVPLVKRQNRHPPIPPQPK